MFLFVYVCLKKNLKNYQKKEVLALPKIEQVKWKEGMEKEMKPMGKRKVFTSMTLPQGCKAVGCKWVYKKKVLPNNEVQYKARLMAQDFSQKKNMHYDEVFVPTVKSESIRLALVLAVARDHKIWHFDIITASLNEKLKEEMYMVQAPRYESKKPNTVYKSNKAIYGLKQSARNWNICLDTALKGHGFKSCKADGCIYTGKLQSEDCQLLAFVGDLCFIAKDVSKKIIC
uniref:Reverse transcriptase Ty1/copia-type domain-containing protein n=1 Tax=Micrurus paraensis TaxID=1970185 RepID=A0A2D4KFF2_9SAUR